MCNKSNKWSYWINWNMFNKVFIPIVIAILFSTLIAACSSYFYINHCIKADSKETIKAFVQIGVIERNQLGIDTVQTKTLDRILNDYSIKMNNLNKSFFDSNVLTFLISFLLIFLGTILLNIEVRANKHVKEAEESIKKTDENISRLEAERCTINLHSQIQSLQILSQYMQSVLESKEYCIDKYTNILNYRVHKMASKLFGELHDDKYKSITKNNKNVFCEIIGDIIYAFQFENCVLKQPKNTGKARPVKETIDVLEKLQKEILGLREID